VHHLVTIQRHRTIRQVSILVNERNRFFALDLLVQRWHFKSAVSIVHHVWREPRSSCLLCNAPGQPALPQDLTVLP
jgi:hypothetical protein